MAMYVAHTAQTVPGREQRKTMEGGGKVVHWGILSTATIANKWVQGAKRVTGAKVLAVASRSLEKAQGTLYNYASYCLY